MLTLNFRFYSYHSLKGAKDSAIAFKNQTPLEIEVAKLLYGSKVNQQTTDESGNSVGLRYTHFEQKKVSICSEFGMNNMLKISLN